MLIDLFEIKAYTLLCGAIIKQCYTDIRKDNKNKKNPRYRVDSKCIRRSVYAEEAERCLESEWGQMLVEYYRMGKKLTENVTNPKKIN